MEGGRGRGREGLECESAGRQRQRVDIARSDEKPLTLILDSVDQLDDTNAGCALQCLPAKDLPLFM